MDPNGFCDCHYRHGSSLWSWTEEQPREVTGTLPCVRSSFMPMQLVHGFRLLTPAFFEFVVQGRLPASRNLTVCRRQEPA